VVGNGHGADDGEVKSGFRWDHQLVGAHSSGPNADWLNRNAIGICLIGDIRKEAPTDAQVHELVWLVRQLQAKFHIPAERVLVEGGDNARDSRFPIVTFRQQLLTPASR
jgi:hypothetical protein